MQAARQRIRGARRYVCQLRKNLCSVEQLPNLPASALQMILLQVAAVNASQNSF